MRIFSLFVYLLIASGYLAGNVIAAPGLCDSELPGDLTYEGLRDWVQACHPLSVGDVVKHLPRPYKLNATFVYESHAESERHHPGTVDPLHPRVILFGNKDLILTYTGMPGTPSYNEIQVMRHRPATGKIDFKVIHIAKEVFYRSSFNEAPTSCVQCHGSPVRPIWGFYPEWPGVYGSDEDTLVDGKPETENYLRFTRSIGNPFGFVNFAPGQDARYAELDRVKPLADRYQHYPFAIRGDDYTRRPNTMLGLVLTEMYATGLKELFVNSIHSRPAKLLFLWEKFDCNGTDFDLPRGATEKALLARLPALRPGDPKFLRDSIFKQVTGVNPVPLSLQLRPKLFRDDIYYNDGFQSQSDSFHDFTRLSERIYDFIANEYAGRYAPLVRIRDGDDYVYGKFPPIMNEFYEANRRWDLSYCRVLAKLARKREEPKSALSNITVAKVTMTNAAVTTSAVPALVLQKSVSPKLNAVASLPFTRCLDCHQGADAEGPILNFEHANRDPRLKAKIWDSVVSGDMPKDGPALSKEELKSIRKFLDQP